jgi:methyl-accepting chemotaxis protein
MRRIQVKQLRPSAFIMRSIRGRLFAGFTAVLVLLLAAGIVGYTSMTSMTRRIDATLHEVRYEARLSSDLQAATAQTLQAGTRYIDMRDSAAQAAFRTQGWRAHAVQRQMNALANRTPSQVALVSEVDARLSAMEVHFARAHRLVDLGRVEQARAEANKAQGEIDALMTNVHRLGEMNSARVADAAESLASASATWKILLILLVAVAMVVAVVVVTITIRGIGRPLDLLVNQARRLSEGDLTARMTRHLPGEFRILGDAMNHVGESLSRVVTVAARTAEDVATSAHQLASVSEQISLSAGQMAGAMSEVSGGAETQVQQLRTVDDQLATMRVRATEVHERATEVTMLAQEIEMSSSDKRAEIERALGILVDVKSSVERAAQEVIALHTTASDINRFVQSVSHIAEQTNLLALNAAIEAARAGAAGRGFAVVADEVRKLAEQSQKAAEDIVQMTGVVQSRVGSSARAMETGANRVAEIERVSRAIDAALAEIGNAAERTRISAGGVTGAALEAVEISEQAATGIAQIARTAEGHAAAAQEVSASTEEQSAACEEMTSASAMLLEGSTRLKTLVGELKTSD